MTGRVGFVSASSRDPRDDNDVDEAESTGVSRGVEVTELAEDTDRVSRSDVIVRCTALDRGIAVDEAIVLAMLVRRGEAIAKK